MCDWIESSSTPEPGKFIQMLRSFQDRFYTVDEFPFIDRKNLPEGILAQAAQLPDDKLKDLAIGLKGKELESLLMDLRDTRDDVEISRGCQILVSRFTPRISKLLIVLYQYYSESPGINKAMDLMCSQLHTLNRVRPEEAFIWHLGNQQDKYEVVSQLMDQYNSIGECFKALSIRENSPFAKEAAFRYLPIAPGEALRSNTKWIIMTIQDRTSEELHFLIQHYLEVIPLDRYHDGINLEILKKLGRPYDSLEWDNYPQKLRERFTQWLYLHRLRIHCMLHPKKFIILSQYFDQVIHSYEMEELDLMVIDFGEIILADVAKDSFSFFYEKESFQREMEEWKSAVREAEQGSLDSEAEPPTVRLPSFLRMDQQQLTARDFIIEEAEDSCVKLSYEGVDVLYIREMLDIKMGLEPDLRRSQLKKMKKRKSEL